MYPRGWHSHHWVPATASFPPPVFDADSLVAVIDMSDWLAPGDPMPPLPQLPELIDEDDWPDEMPWAWQDSYSEEQMSLGAVSEHA